MAPLLARLFTNRKRIETNCSFELKTDFKRWRPPQFSASSQVRVLLFRECSVRGRKLVFDSASVYKKETSTPPPPNRLSSFRLFSPKESSPQTPSKPAPQSYIEVVSNGTTYEYHPRKCDTKDLGEMILGTVALSTQTSTKLHTIKSPPQLMISLVFPGPIMESRSTVNSPTSLHNSTSEICISKSSKSPDSSSQQLAHSVPMDVPSQMRHSSNMSDSLPSLDSGSGSLTRSTSSTNLQRRLLRCLSTSIEDNYNLPSPSPKEKLLGKRKITLGLGIVFALPVSDSHESSQLKDFIFSHIILLMGHIRYFQQTILNCYYHQEGSKLTDVLYTGTRELWTALDDLYTAPRLTAPAWLSILASPTSTTVPFVSAFSSLLQEYDVKSTNFFVSTLLTAVLSLHLSWIPTVLPPVASSRSQISGFPRNADWVESLARSHPYNPLWMQLADLYGTILGGITTRKSITRIIVTGQHNPDLLQQILLVLSYFLRCADVCEREFDQPTMIDISSAFQRCSQVSLDAPASKPPSLQVPPRQQQAFLDNWTINENYTIHEGNGGVHFSIGESPNNYDSHMLNHIDHPSLSSGDNTAISKDKLSNEEAGIYDSLACPLLLDKLESVEEESEVSSSADSHLASSRFQASKTPAIRIGSKESDDQPQPSLSTILDQSRLYIQQYQSLRFAPERLSGTWGTSEEVKCSTNSGTNTQAPIEESSLSKQVESGLSLKENVALLSEDSSEDGYHSMEESRKGGHSPFKLSSGLSELLSENILPHEVKEVGLTRLTEGKIVPDLGVYHSLGWSLMAGISDHFLHDFCLHGILGHPPSPDLLHQDLLNLILSPILGEPLDEARCIVADVDHWQVLVYRCQREDSSKLNVSQPVMAPLVASMCDSLLSMTSSSVPPELCVTHLEDCLQEVVQLSQCLVHQAGTLLPPGVEAGDLPLLTAVASSCYAV